jgi:hypothetical protein
LKSILDRKTRVKMQANLLQTILPISGKWLILIVADHFVEINRMVSLGIESEQEMRTIE